MTIDTVNKRVTALQKIWLRGQDAKLCDILLKQIKSDIVFFCHESVPFDLQNKIDELQKEIWRHDHK